MTIATNRHWRPVLQAWDLTPKERAQFDYLDWERIMASEDSREFIRYRGVTYDLGDFSETMPRILRGKGWDGWQSDSFYSGIVVRWSEDGDQIMIGTVIF